MIENLHALALKIENIARDILKITNRPYGEIYDADSIESYSLYKVVCNLFEYKNIKCEELIEELKKYENKGLAQINNVDIIIDNVIKLLKQ